MKSFPQPTGSRRQRAFTMTEVLTTIAILGVLSGMAVAGYGNIVEKSKNRIARNLVETLNKGTRNYSHANQDLKFNAIAASGGDEMLVFRSLQWRDSDGVPGEKENFYKGPYIRDDWNPSISDDTKDWRIQWTGSAWALLMPNDVGAGIKVDFEGTDLGTPYVFPPNFKPVGSR